MTANIIPIKGAKEAPKASRSTMETLIVSVDEVAQWRVPPFQRPVRVNEKVRRIAEEMRQGVSIPGVITLGRVGREQTLYIVDGQHRIEAFRDTGLREIIADIRICHFDTIAEMADEFVQLNTALVRMRPDDILRGLEPSVEALKDIRSSCPFVGYDQIRRGNTSSPIVGMSVVQRSWSASAFETPTASASGLTTAQIASSLDAIEKERLILFLATAHAAWGRDPEYFRLWSVLNLTMCMWLYRRLVWEHNSSPQKRTIKVSIAQFKQCLMGLSANENYLDWLQGRALRDRDRSPCYARVKDIFQRRLQKEGEPKPKLPQPAWASA